MDVKNATADGPKCIQWSESTFEVVGNENCLYLNIFVPTVSEYQRRNFVILLFIIHVIIPLN